MVTDDADLQWLRASLQAPAVPVTKQDLVDVLVQLEALSYAGGAANVCEFAMEVINGMLMHVDADILE